MVDQLMYTIHVGTWDGTLMDGMKQLHADSALCDLEIQSNDDQSFHVHSCVLASTSPVLATLLLELEQDQTRPWKLGFQASSHLIRHLIQFIYTGELLLPATDLEAMEQLAISLEISGLVSCLKSCESQDDEISKTEQSLSQISELPSTGNIFPVSSQHESIVQLEEGSDITVTDLIGIQTLPPDVGQVVSLTDQENIGQLVDFMTSLQPKEENHDYEAGLAQEITFIPTSDIDTGPTIESSTMPVAFANATGIVDGSVVEQNNQEPVKKKRKPEHEGIVFTGKGFQCRRCAFVSTSLSGVVQHERIHTGEKPYVCPVCRRAFRTSSNRTDHWKRSHAKHRPHTCAVCPKSFKTPREVHVHMRTHGSIARSKQPCDIPATADSDLSPKSKNEKSSHDAKETVNNQDCAVHNGSKPPSELEKFPCTKCNKIYLNAEDLKKHAVSHKDGHRFACHKCSATFQKQYELKNHKTRMHSDKRPVACIHCDATFKTESDVKRHCISMHGTKLQCPLCTRQFGHAYQLKRHSKEEHKFALPQDVVKKLLEDARRTDSCTEIASEKSENIGNSESEAIITDNPESKMDSDTAEAMSGDIASAESESILPTGTQTEKNIVPTEITNLQSGDEKSEVSTAEDKNANEQPLHSETTSTQATSRRSSRLACRKSTRKSKNVHNENLAENEPEGTAGIGVSLTGEETGKSIEQSDKSLSKEGDKHTELVPGGHDSVTTLIKNMTGENSPSENITHGEFHGDAEVARHAENKPKSGKTEDNNRHMCQYCAKIFRTKRLLAKHEKSHSEEDDHVCPTCGNTFNDGHELVNHYKLCVLLDVAKTELDAKKPAQQESESDSEPLVKGSHGDLHGFPCPKCNKTFCSKSSLKVHSYQHTGERPYSCKECGQRFTTSSHRNNHYRRTHTDSRPFMCEVCAATFKMPQDYKRHMLVHGTATSKVYPCEYCKKVFPKKANLTAHMNIHLDNRPFICRHCGASFPSKSGCKAHESRHEGQTKTYNCSQCQRFFQSLAGYERHMLKHSGVKPHSCSHCPKTFLTNSEKMKHEEIHLQSSEFSCPQCQKCFKTMARLRSHVVTHSDLRPYICEVCNRGFKSALILKCHSRVHSDKKEFTCPTCSQSFRARSTLNDHMSVHTGERPYECSTCGERFTHRTSLHRHRNKHKRDVIHVSVVESIINY